MAKKWFEGSILIDSSIKSLQNEMENQGKFYEGVISLMSGITSAELLEQGKDFLIIKTNEGLMKRTNIRKSVEPEKIMVEFDEEYKAGKAVTAHTHFYDEFTSAEKGISYKTTISDVKASGFLGLIYRLFGSANIGKAVLSSHKAYLEKLRE